MTMNSNDLGLSTPESDDMGNSSLGYMRSITANAHILVSTPLVQQFDTIRALSFDRSLVLCKLHLPINRAYIVIC